MWPVAALLDGTSPGPPRERPGLSSGVLVLLGDLNSWVKKVHTNTTYKDNMLGGPAPSKPSAEPWGARARRAQSVGRPVCPIGRTHH